MKVGFGCDHAAVELKNALLEHLKERGYECVDFGSYAPEDKVDYPVIGQKVGEALVAGEIDKGVLVCGTGIGISISANKVPGVRAAVCSEPYSAKLTAMHNDANIIAMGARVVGVELAKMIVDSFFDAEFEGGRHQRRVDLIKDIEAKYSK
ncbi:MAG: ribose 5-phosphate isomerase B [Clostridiales bacterium]|nr:ribose 5-phosphate isomerase B [Clostridiales bacterium]